MTELLCGASHQSKGRFFTEWLRLLAADGAATVNVVASAAAAFTIVFMRIKFVVLTHSRCPWCSELCFAFLGWHTTRSTLGQEVQITNAKYQYSTKLEFTTRAKSL